MQRGARLFVGGGQDYWGETAERDRLQTGCLPEIPLEEYDEVELPDPDDLTLLSLEKSAVPSLDPKKKKKKSTTI